MERRLAINHRRICIYIVNVHIYIIYIYIAPRVLLRVRSPRIIAVYICLHGVSLPIRIIAIASYIITFRFNAN